MELQNLDTSNGTKYHRSKRRSYEVLEDTATPVLSNRKISRMLLGSETSGNYGSMGSRHLLNAIGHDNMNDIRKFSAKMDSEQLNTLDETGLSPLHHAARLGMKEAISVLIEDGASIDLKTTDGSTALHLAIRHRKGAVAEMLLDHGANPSLIDANGLSALHMAARKSLPSVIKKICEVKIADVDSQDTRMNSALHYSTIASGLESCKILLENGACPHLRNAAGETILHVATGENRVEIIKLVLTQLDESEHKHKTTKEYINETRKDSKTALHLAAQIGNLEAVEILIERGADLLALTTQRKTPLHLAAASGNVDIVKLLLSKDVSPNIQNNSRHTPLHEAVNAGHKEIVEALLQGNAKIGLKDEFGTTPFLLAVSKNYNEIVEVLLDNGASPADEDMNLKSGLHYAVENGNYDLAAMLSKRFPSLIQEKDDENRTPLHYAAFFGHAKIIEFFKTLTMQLDDTENNGDTPLHIAAKRGNVSCIKVLVNHAKSELIDFCNPRSQTPLHVAAINKQFDACKVLLENNAEVDITDKTSWTPLHYAAFKDSADIVELLLQFNANINYEDDWGSTPLMAAAEAGNVESLNALLKKGANVRISNKDGDNFFDVALEFRRENAIKAILESERWKEAIASKDENGKHFMKKLIEKYPELAEIVLDRSVTFSDHHSEHPDFKVTFDFKFLEEYPKETEGVLADTAAAFKTKRNRLYFGPRVMAKHERDMLMEHPIVTSLLSLKWKNAGRYLYYLSFLIYLIYILSLTVLVVMEAKTFVRIQEQKAKANTTKETDEKIIKQISKELPSSQAFGKGLAYFILIFCTIQIIKEFMQLLVLRHKYFISLPNMIEGVLYCATMYYIVSFNFKENLNSSLYKSGVLCVFLGWSNLLLFLQRIPMYRLYIVMFLTVCFTILKLLLVFGIIILSFALTFYLLFIGQKAFRSPQSSLTKVLIMMTGEFEFEDSLTTKLGKKNTSMFSYVPYPNLSYVVFIVFVFLVAVAFTNLLIGLAVGDIEKIREMATISVLEQQLEFLDTVQGIMPKKMQKKYIYKPEVVYYINRKTNIERMVEQLTSSTTDSDLKKLRMKKMDFEMRRNPVKLLQESIEMEVEKRRLTQLESLLSGQQNMFAYNDAETKELV